MASECGNQFKNTRTCMAFPHCTGFTFINEFEKNHSTAHSTSDFLWLVICGVLFHHGSDSLCRIYLKYHSVCLLTLLFIESDGNPLTGTRPVKPYNCWKNKLVFFRKVSEKKPDPNASLSFDFSLIFVVYLSSLLLLWIAKYSLYSGRGLSV